MNRQVDCAVDLLTELALAYLSFGSLKKAANCANRAKLVANCSDDLGKVILLESEILLAYVSFVVKGN